MPPKVGMTAPAASRTDSERAVVRATIAVKKFYDRVEGERMWEGLKLERHVKVSVVGLAAILLVAATSVAHPASETIVMN
jgi:hypothetical protein